MKRRLLIALIFPFLVKTTVFCNDNFVSPVILNETLFCAIKTPTNLSDHQGHHIKNMLKTLCLQLCPSQPTNHSTAVCLKNLAKNLKIKSDFYRLSILKKLLVILVQDLAPIPCTGKSCQACQANILFIVKNGEQVKLLADSLEKKSHWWRRLKLKKKYLISMALLGAPPMTWIFRGPLTNLLTGPINKFIKLNLPWFLPFLASCLSFFGFCKFYPNFEFKKTDKNTPPPSNENNDNFEANEKIIGKNPLPPIESEIDVLGGLFEQASAHFNAMKSEINVSLNNLETKVRATQLEFFTKQTEEKKLKREESRKNAQKIQEEGLLDSDTEKAIDSTNIKHAKKHRRGAMTSSSLTGFPQKTERAGASSSVHPTFSSIGPRT